MLYYYYYYYYRIVIIVSLAKGKNKNKINPHKFSQILQNKVHDGKILGKVTTFKITENLRIPQFRG